MSNLKKCMAMVAIILGFLQVPCLQAGVVTKAATGTVLTAGASWGGLVPGSGDTATWIASSLGTGLTLGSGVTWGMVDVQGAASAIGITGSGVLTLNGVGGAGINLATGGVDLNLANPITLGGAQAWTVGTGRALTISGNVTNGTNLLSLGGGGNTTLSGVIGGSGGLAKNGTGTLTLSGTPNFTGNTAINNGRLVLTNTAVTSDISPTTTISVGSVLEWNVPTAPYLGAAALNFTGSGILQKTGSGMLTIGFNAGNRSHTISLSAGGVFDVQLGDLNVGWDGTASFAANHGGLYLAPGTTLHNSQAGGMKFDWLAGSGKINNAYNSTTPVLTIGADGTVNNAVYGVINNTATFSGTIGYAESYNGVNVSTLNVVKTGAGTQILSGINGWTGSTTISGGALLIYSPGSLAATAVTVQNGGTFGGNGTVAGPVTLQSGATLAPGTASSIGTLKINNSLAFAAGGIALMEINKTSGALTNDLVQGMTGVTYGGALLVTATGDALAATNKFTLFSKASGSYSGVFASFSLPSLAGGLDWDTSGLTVDGSIKVVTTTTVMKPAFNAPGGFYNSAQSVTISSNFGSTIYYTTDGTTPNASSLSGPSPITIPISSARTLKAYATLSGYTNSAVATASYAFLIAPDLNYYMAPGGSMTISVPDLLASSSGATALQSIGTSSNGATISLYGSQIFYAAGSGTANPDNFTYTVNDGQGHVASARVYVHFVTQVSNGKLSGVSNGLANLNFAGIPNGTYYVQSSTNLKPDSWQTIAMSTADAGGLWNYMADATKPREFFRAAPAGNTSVGTWVPSAIPEPPAPLASVLEPLAGGFRALTCGYTSNQLVAGRAFDWSATGNTLQGSVRNGAANWSYNSTVTNLPASTGTAVSMQWTARLVSGQATSTGVAAAFDFGNWSTNNYVMIPSVVYSGNRHRTEFSGYGGNFAAADWYDPNLPLTQSDCPRLSTSPTGESKLEILTGAAATPAMCFFSPSQQRGFILLTEQKSRFGDLGLMIQESPDRKTASFVVSAPGVRKLRPIFGGFATSSDVGATWNPGDSVTLNFQLHSFPCADIPALLARFHEVRKNLTGPNQPRCITPASQLQSMYASVIDGMYSGNTSAGYYRNENASWVSFGWVGGLMNTFPMLALGDATRLNKVKNTFNFAIPAAQTPSGYTHYRINADGTTGDARTSSTGVGTELTRCQGDLLFWMCKQMMLLKAQGKASSINPAWETFTRKLAVAMVNTWNLRHEFGMYLDLNTGDVALFNSTGGAMIPAGLALASQYFNEPSFMTVAQESATMYYNRDFVGLGQTAGACADIMENADAETAYGFMTALMALYETTGDTQWLNKSRGLADLCSTWTISYDYAFPVGTECYNLGAHVAGGVWASTQNRHAVCVPCTSSADPLFKLYRAGQGRRYAELVRDIASCANDLTARSDRPTYGNVPGSLMERLQTSDAEGTGAIGDLPTGMNGWVVLGAMLQTLELPGIYVRLDADEHFVFDHITSSVVSRNANGVTLSITNPTILSASVTVFGENATQAAQPLGYSAFLNWPKVTVNAGATVSVLVKPDGSLQTL